MTGDGKKRISITLTPEIQKYLDSMIGEKRFASYQHAVDFCLTCLAQKKMLIVNDDFAQKIDEILSLMKKASGP
jgi:Arc/MetJ-type ribon-helix-helix transcriptional regulator